MKRLSQRLYRYFTQSILSVFVISSLLACNTAAIKNDSSLPDSAEEVVIGDDIAAKKPVNGKQASPLVESTAQSQSRPQSKAQSKPQANLKLQLDGELLYNILAGEFAGVQGKMQQSIGFYAKAARLTEDPDVVLRAAYIALYAGNDIEAIELTDRWLQLGLQETYRVTRIRALSYLHLQQLQQTVELFGKLIVVNGRVSKRSIATLTRVLGQEASAEFALQLVYGLDKKHPNQTQILLLVAKIETNLGRYELALSRVNHIIELDDNMADAYLIKAQILAAQGHQKQAVAAIKIAVEKRPEDRRLRMQFARMLVQMRDFSLALEHFLVLKKAMPNDENVLLSLGLLSIETDQNEQAKEYLQVLLDNGYHNPQAHYYLGRIQQSMNEDMAAMANYEQVLSGDYWLDARIRIAAILARTGSINAALMRLESLGKSEKLESNQIKVSLAKGRLLSAVSRNQEAYSVYDTALGRSPDNTDLLYARALTAEKLNMLDVTESDLKQVIKREPENASALNALGYTLADRTERLNEAREYILKAARLLPDDPAILDSLGWVYFRLGEYDNAIKWLSKAFASLKDAEIAAHLGEALWVNGQISEAEKIWKKGEKLSGNQELLSDTIQRLKQ